MRRYFPCVQTERNWTRLHSWNIRNSESDCLFSVLAKRHFAIKSLFSKFHNTFRALLLLDKFSWHVRLLFSFSHFCEVSYYLSNWQCYRISKQSGPCANLSKFTENFADFCGISQNSVYRRDFKKVPMLQWSRTTGKRKSSMKNEWLDMNEWMNFQQIGHEWMSESQNFQQIGYENDAF